MEILKQQVCEIEAIVNHFIKMLHPFKCLISGFDGLQLASNQPRFEAFKARHHPTLGRGWVGGWRKSQLRSPSKPRHYTVTVGVFTYQMEVSKAQATSPLLLVKLEELPVRVTMRLLPWGPLSERSN